MTHVSTEAPRAIPSDHILIALSLILYLTVRLIGILG